MAKLASIAIVGGETLLGRELRELLEQSGLTAEVNLYSASGEETGIFTQERGEAAIMTPLTSANLASTKLVFLVGEPDRGAKLLEMLPRGKPAPVIIDLVGALEDNHEARLRAPAVEAGEKASGGPIQVIAHPAAIALTLFLKQLQSVSSIRQSVVMIFEPVSERGQSGLDELQQQTVGLLSFKKLKKDVFDAQVSFNMLPRYGAEAPRSLEDVEQNIYRHLASLLARNAGIPMPSFRLIQAPVFHGYSISAWVEFENNPGAEAIAAGLATSEIEVRTGEEEAPSNVGAAGQSGITVGAIAVDQSNPRACWFWIVADNLRIAAENAVEVARAVVE